MKKILLAMAACASMMSAQADVTLFVAQGAPMCRYHGNADQTMVMYPGYTFRFHGQTYQRVDVGLTQAGFVEKEMPSDRVQLWGVHMDGVNTVSCDHVLAGTLRWYANRSMLFTPAEGLTVTKIEMKFDKFEDCQVAVVEPDGTSFKVLNNFTYNSTDTTLTMTGSYDKPFYVLNLGKNSDLKTGTLRPFYIEVTTTGTSKQVAIPEYSIKHNMVAANEAIELTCATPGAKIYYTIDHNGKWNGTRVNGGVRSLDPTTASTLYTEPITLEKDAIIRAIAVKDGMTTSFMTYKEFYVMPQYDEMAVFNFNDHTSIKDEDGNQIADFATYPVVDTEVSTSTVQTVSLASNIAVDKAASFSGTITDESAGTGCDLTLSNTFGGVVELRPKTNSKMYISVPDDKYLTAVFMEASHADAISLDEVTPGTLKNGFTTNCQKIWTVEGKDCYEVELNVTAKDQYVDRIFVFYGDPTLTGIDNVSIDENAPVEYYNLQGCRVVNPVKGQVVIKRQGTKATKVIL